MGTEFSFQPLFNTSKLIFEINISLLQIISYYTKINKFNILYGQSTSNIMYFLIKSPI